MSSAKTERLVNLTMALLGSNRFMTKSEIFRRVSGYAGSQETKERMFERDKDDLRSLGIEIEVASHDPLFDDEIGYRIRPEVYQLQNEFSSEELGIMSLALSLISEGPLAQTGNLLARRIHSLSVRPDTPEGVRLRSDEIYEEGLSQVLEALADRNTIEFDYQKGGVAQAERRRVNPLGLSAWQGSWYLVAEDLERDDVRVFKLSRIVGAIIRDKKSESYSIPPDFKVEDFLVMLKPKDYQVKVKLRKFAGTRLRSKADLCRGIDEEWDELDIAFSDAQEALRELLWLGDDVLLLAPRSLQDQIISSLERVRNLHG